MTVQRLSIPSERNETPIRIVSSPAPNAEPKIRAAPMIPAIIAKERISHQSLIPKAVEIKAITFLGWKRTIVPDTTMYPILAIFIGAIERIFMDYEPPLVILLSVQYFADALYTDKKYPMPDFQALGIDSADFQTAYGCLSEFMFLHNVRSFP